MEIKYLVIDVDGTMTDGGIYYDENGNETKKFNTRDAVGFFAAHQAGIKIMVLTGRECKATARRMTELNVELLCQNIKDKAAYLREFMDWHDITKEQIGYIGDDLNDLRPMTLCGYIGCPENACAEVKSIAHYVSPLKGGDGAVRDVIEHLLKLYNIWEPSIANIYGFGV